MYLFSAPWKHQETWIENIENILIENKWVKPHIFPPIKIRQRKTLNSRLLARSLRYSWLLKAHESGSGFFCKHTLFSWSIQFSAWSLVAYSCFTISEIHSIMLLDINIIAECYLFVVKCCFWWFVWSILATAFFSVSFCCCELMQDRFTQLIG